MGQPFYVADVLDWFENNQVAAHSPAAAKERQRVRTLFYREHGRLPLDDARPHHLKAFIDGHKGNRSNHTRRRWKATINAPFNEAERLGFIVKNPFRGLRFPKGPRGRDWTDEEFRAVLRTSHAYFRRFVVFLRFSGARPGEARLLTWPEVRDDMQAIIQEQHKTAHCSDEPRRIHYNNVLFKMLCWLRRERGRQPPAVACCRKTQLAARPHEFVFTNGFGRPWTPQSLTKHLRMIRRRIGLAPGVKMHGMRHTFATHGLMNGVDLATMAELLGHKRIETTAIYLHLAHKRPHLNAAMDRAISGPMAPARAGSRATEGKGVSASGASGVGR